MHRLRFLVFVSEEGVDGRLSVHEPAFSSASTLEATAPSSLLASAVLVEGSVDLATETVGLAVSIELRYELMARILLLSVLS